MDPWPGTPRQCSWDATASPTLSWFGSLPDTAKDSTSCRRRCLAIFGHSYFSWWQRLPSTEPEGSGCIPGPLAVGHPQCTLLPWDGTRAVPLQHRRKEGWTCLPPQRGGHLKCSAHPIGTNPLMAGHAPRAAGSPRVTLQKLLRGGRWISPAGRTDRDATGITKSIHQSPPPCLLRF